jgi:hypothetical protein
MVTTVVRTAGSVAVEGVAAAMACRGDQAPDAAGDDRERRPAPVATSPASSSPS